MLSNSRILAQGKIADNIVFLTQVDSTYVLVLGTTFIQKGIFSKKTTFKVLDQKILTAEEALLALEQIKNLQKGEVSSKLLSAPQLPGEVSPYIEDSIVLLLETSKEAPLHQPEKKKTAPTLSPYYPTKEIFLASQMTCAPNMY
ncbi:MAG: hypothetical protein FGM57_01095 [Candidatus Taylorbacteria bacterium]|nr:hypothetical protein [Candidatus Taylorbacteria bacterium]